jgi:RimJ/RimL family protein N-acetyltransferase
MTLQPTLRSDRLVLRPFTLADAPDVQRLAGDRDIASTTLNIPHPYEDGMAETWIGGHQERFEKGEQVSFAVVLEDGTLIGAMGLHVNQEFERAELGYWIGKPYWGRGYCTEAAKTVLHYGFETLGLNRIQARHLARNPASGRVMQKIGMRYEGYLRQHVNKWGIFEDIELYAILKSEYIS